MGGHTEPDPESSTLSDDELELLVRVDEQTQASAEKLDELADKVEENRQDIDSLETKVQRNTTILSGITGGISFVTLWAADKLSRFF